MTEQIYVFRYGAVYKIGKTESIKRLIRDSNPDEIIQTIETKEPDLILARLYRKFKQFRLPESNYFLLRKDKLNLCKQLLRGSGNLLLSNNQELYITLVASTLITVFSFYVFQIFNLPILTRFGVSMALGSFPLWLLSLTGNFGGYEVKDLPLFSTWANRIKSLIFASSISLTAYALISLKIFFEHK